MRIKKIHLTAFRNEEHFQFMTDVKNLIEAVGALTLPIDGLYLSFTDLYAKEDIAVEMIRKSTFTDSIADADAKRDHIYRGFVLMVQAYGHSTNTNKIKASQNIQVIVDHYGDFRKKSYNEVTATIYNFLQDMDSRCSDDIQMLNVREWISDLESADKTFAELMNRRFDEYAAQETIQMRATRIAIDKIYTQMLDRVNAFILLNGESAFVDFVNKLNERIAYFKQTVALRKGRKTPNP